MVHQEYEEKIKGLMPAEVRQELEDTITSLKAQVRTHEGRFHTQPNHQKMLQKLLIWRSFAI